MTRAVRKFCAALLCAAFVAAAPVSHGATLQISPVRIHLSDKAPITAIVIKNTEANEALLQLQMTQWRQQGEHDQLTPSTDIVVSPAIFRLPANAEQIVRIGLNNRTPEEIERSFRLIVQEVPRHTDQTGNGIRALLRVTIPVFVQAATPQAVRLRWMATPGGDGALVVAAENAGNVHVQVLGLDVSDSGGRSLASRGAADYILPGQRKTWSFRDSSGLMTGQVLQLRARTDQGEFGEALSLGLSPNVSDAK